MTPAVLAGVDGSPESTVAAHWAAGEALRRGAPLRLLHAWPWLTDGRASFADPEDLPVAAQRMLAAVAEEVGSRHPGLTVQTDVVLDAAVDGLVAATEASEASEDAGLLVLGSRGLGGFKGLLVGSVSMAVAGRAAVPVVVVRQPGPETGAETSAESTGESGAVSEVVVGVDAGAPSDTVLDFAFREAELRGARVRAVHGWNLPASFAVVGFLPSGTETAQLRAVEEKALAAALAGHRARYPHIEVVEQARLGAARTLVEDTEDAALLVVGRRRRPHDLAPRLGRTAHAVLHHARPPIAVVPHP
ncbi:universal stress protein [Kitasatospora purpeofusca]|uniref:universal stress protein n=1 Tax=Kitasatospora purpeofusca TaxID=67352 RepID=UPI00224EF733|nr:universal stress protein [Kitasatospora purpeofusca]MCX4759172.1 universal stress protein [Kitasatospora purpeofusca]WSR30423.1 universal stress protein [Kitasatospora purpeofusca]WSR38662.1 universal stress protein [Kitasatospora purpeofusca]